MSEVLALLACLGLCGGSAWTMLRGRVWHQGHVSAVEDRKERRRQRLVRRLVERGEVRRGTAPATHNDYDYACRYWWGDRRPVPRDERNVEPGGAGTPLPARRCVVCRPFADDEADDLLALGPLTDEDGR